ncbi:LamG domain-containing protein [Longispora albida]|uniref:LamG domain-containing protein n=1 Tax=Longispora albida TaxID=203523 RepID=UPI00146CB4FC|nr:LamG domain-containing protein [Longispora albida]
MDLTLVKNTDGSYSPAAAAQPVTISGGGTGPMVSAERSGSRLSLGWPGKLPAPVVSGDTATYPELMPGVDLKVRAEVTGFSEVLVVKTREAAANPALAKLRFTLATQGLTMSSGPGGSTVAKDAAGDVVFASGTAWMWDSYKPGQVAARSALAAPSAPAVPTADIRRLSPMTTELSSGQLTVTPQQSVLTGAGTVFPLYIDPGYASPKSANWSMINKAYPTQSYWAYDRNQGAKVGYEDDEWWPNNTYRSMFLFSPSTYAGKHVLDATLSAKINHTWDCGSGAADLYVSGVVFGPGTDWTGYNGQFSSGNLLASGAEGNCGGHSTTWNSPALTNTVNASSGWANLVFGLRARDESNHHGWKTFDPASLTLSVKFNNVPNVPGNLRNAGIGCASWANRPYLNTATPELRARVSDPDGENLNTVFEWWVTGGSMIGSATVYATLSGYDAVLNVPAGALGDGDYSWRVRSSDGIDWGPYSGFCEMTIDRTRPWAEPTITSPDYPADVTSAHGGVGRPGLFTLGANGVSDVVGYEYGLADDPTTYVAASTLGGTATVSVTPLAYGITTLYVRSIDRAGHKSDVKKNYVFKTGAATGPVGHWELNGNGDPAAGSQALAPSGGAVWTAGRISGGPQSLGLNGGTAGAAAAVPVIDTSKSFSMSAWVRPDRPGTDYPTAVGVNSASANPVGMGLDASGHWTIWARPNESSGGTNPAVGSKAPLGVWAHLTGTYEASTRQLRLYVNGSLAATSNLGFAIGRATGPLTLGHYQWAGGWGGAWSGDIADVRVYDRVVYPDSDNDADVKELTKAIGVGQWSFNNGQGTSATDDGPFGRNATLAGGASWGTGHDQTGLRLNGTSAYAATSFSASADAVLDTKQSFSIEAWVKLADTNSTHVVVSQNNLGGSYNPFYVEYNKGLNRWLITSPSDGSSPQEWRYATGSSVPAVGAWTHIAAVFDASAGELRFYVNGTHQGTRANVTGWNAAGALEFGRARNGSYFAGDIDEVKVYAGVRSLQEIATAAAQ